MVGMETGGNWFDALAEGVVLVDGGVVRQMNRAAARFLGAEADWARGKRLITVVRDHRLERVWSHGETIELRLGGRSIEAVPIPGGLALRDVTEVRTAREDAEALLAALSHELRTPITTVRSTLEALDDSAMPAGERSRLLERAIGEADRVVRLLADLTTEVAPPRARSVAVSETLLRAESILAPTLAEHSVELRHSVHDVGLWADPDKLLQVLLNLIENAAVHGPRGAVVEVLARVLDGWVELTVRDAGEPLTADHPALAVLAATRPPPRSRRHGMGLYVVRSIAEGWGGRLWWREWRDAGRAGNEFGVLVPGSREAASDTRGKP